MIDIHPHIISPDHVRHPFSPLMGRPSPWSHSRPVSIEQLLQDMDAAGVTAAAVVQSSTAYGYECSYLAESAQRYPHRVVGVGCVDITQPDAVEVLSHWVVDGGFSGIRVFTTGTTMPGQAPWINSAATAPAWDWLRDHDVTVSVQLQPAGYDDLRAVVEQRPGLRVVLDHCGRPPVAGADDDAEGGRLCALAQLDSVFLKLTSGNLVRSPPGKDAWLRNAIRTFGPERIAWGSNYPASEGPYGDLVRLVRDRLSGLELADSEQQLIYAGTARRLYPALPGRG